MLACVMLAGCQAACPFPGQRRVTRLDLFFGRDIPGGGRVGDAAWQDFTARVLTPAFPDGFTVFAGAGQWLDPEQHRVIREDSLDVLIVGRVTPAEVAAVSRAYRSWFHQKAVGVVNSEACAAF